MEKRTKSQWEEAFVVCLVRLRDFFLDQKGQSLVGIERASAVQNLVFQYFLGRRAPISTCSCLMNCEDMAEYINDKVLDYIVDERPDLLTVDWKQMYVLRAEEPQDIFEDDSEDCF